MLVKSVARMVACTCRLVLDLSKWCNVLSINSPANGVLGPPPPPRGATEHCVCVWNDTNGPCFGAKTVVLTRRLRIGSALENACLGARTVVLTRMRRVGSTLENAGAMTTACGN